MIKRSNCGKGRNIDGRDGFTWGTSTWDSHRWRVSSSVHSRGQVVTTILYEYWRKWWHVKRWSAPGVWSAPKRRESGQQSPNWAHASSHRQLRLSQLGRSLIRFDCSQSSTQFRRQMFDRKWFRLLFEYLSTFCNKKMVFIC